MLTSRSRSTDSNWSGCRRCGFDPASGDAFASNAGGTLTVIQPANPDTYHVIQPLATVQSSRNMGLDPTNHRIFLAAAKFGPLAAGFRRRPVLPGSFNMLVVERGASPRE